MLRYVIFVLNAIGLALWALTFFEFICANVAKLARKRYLVHDICQSTLILACIDAHPNAPYSPNEVDFEKKGKKKSIMTSYCRNYGKSSNYFLNINPNWHEVGHLSFLDQILAAEFLPKISKFFWWWKIWIIWCPAKLFVSYEKCLLVALHS